MTEKIHLNYSPALNPLEETLVQGESIADRMVEMIRNSALTSSRSHQLMVGGWGLGKTHLMDLVLQRITAMEELASKLAIARLGEGQWGVSSFLDLILRLLGAMAADPDKTAPIYLLPEKEAEASAMALLKEQAGQRIILVAVENLQGLFNGIRDRGQRLLRAFMQETKKVILLASTDHLFDQISSRTAPFYGTFTLHHLSPLTLDKAEELLFKIARLKEDHSLASFLQTAVGKARVQAAAHLFSGSPRLFSLFSQHLTADSLDGLRTPLIKTVDALSPHYQSKIAGLSLQQQRILDFICMQRAGVSVKIIAKHCFIKHQAASSQLKLLKDKGVVKATSLGRDAFYEFQDPMLRLWMEFKKDQGRSLNLIIDFLRTYFSPTEPQNSVTQLFLTPGDPLENSFQVHALINKHAEQNTLSLLAKELVCNAMDLNTELFAPAVRSKWAKVWRAAANDFDEMRTAISLFQTAVQHINDPNPRTLLGLPEEERSLLTELFKNQKEQQAK